MAMSNDNKNSAKGFFDLEPPEEISGSLFARLRAYFLAGILVTAPIGITIFLTLFFLRFVDDQVTSIIPEHYNPFNYLPLSVPGIEIVKSLVSLVIVFLFFVLVGWFARNFLGRLIYKFSENLVHSVPGINAIYKAIKQIFETVMASKSQAFREAVLIEYPRKGIWSIGFVTGMSKGEVQRLTSDDTINVFIPTTPNPTSGFLLFVPKKDVIFLSMSVEDAAKMIISAGIITPPDVSVRKNEDEKKNDA